jgi:putative transposase
MEQDKAVDFRRPDAPSEDSLTEVLRRGARALLAPAVAAEVTAFRAAPVELVDEPGRRRLVRNGCLPERVIQTGSGPVPVRQPRVRDRGAARAEPSRFTAAILPRHLRRSRSLEELLPWLWLKGANASWSVRPTGDFGEALAALLGADAPGLSASTIGRLKEVWRGEFDAWQARDLAGKRYVYFWVDGVHCNARLDQERQCILVVIGADAHGRKELVGLSDG